MNRFCNGSRKQNGDGIAYLLILLNSAALKTNFIRKALYPRSFTDSNDPVLIWVKEGPPMGVAFGQNGRSKAFLAKSSVTLSVVRAPSSFHSRRQ